MRFKVGELAIFAVGLSPQTMRIVGEEVEVLAMNIKAGVFYFGRVACADADYLIRTPGNGGTLCHDWQLRKKEPPQEPESMTRTSDIDEEITA